ncbi:MAG: hypothetical protein EON87_00580 [Brevundimonas sp.]|nr:MAG: hypothetical protein EON87_00580 [Brevundimonas sp.]
MLSRLEKPVVTVLLALFLANGNFNGELTTLLGLGAAIVLGGTAAFRSSARIAAPTLILLVLAGVVSLLAGRIGFDAARSMYTILRLPIYLALGIAIMIRYRDIRIPINALIIACVGLSLYFIQLYVTSPDIVAAGRYTLRTELAGGWNILPFGAAAALYVLMSNARLSRGAAIGLMGVIALALFTILLCQSRTALLGAIILAVFMVGLVPTRVYSMLVVPLVFTIIVCFTTPVLSMLISVDVVGMIDSVAPTAIRELLALDRMNPYEINNFWRGYETFSAFTYVDRQGALAVAFGTGLHTLVPLREIMLLADRSYAEIPHFHNMLSFSFLRGGVVGIILAGAQYVFMARPLQKLALTADPKLRLLGRMGMGIHLGLIVAIPATTGFLNQTELGASAVTMIGAIAACVALQSASQARAAQVAPQRRPGKLRPAFLSARNR